MQNLLLKMHCAEMMTLYILAYNLCLNAWIFGTEFKIIRPIPFFLKQDNIGNLGVLY